MRKILVLSGGGSHGCFEIGIVSRLIQDGKGSWDLITGVSAGSINACYLSTIEKDDEKNHIVEFKKLWTDFKNADVYSNEFFLNGLSIFNNELFRKKLETIFGDKKPIRPVIIGTTSLSTSESKIFSNKDMMEEIAAFNIKENKLIDTVAIFKTKTKKLNRISLAFDFFSVVDKPKRALNLITYDEKKKIIYIPVVDDNGKVSNRNILYQLKGSYFEFIGIETEKRK